MDFLLGFTLGCVITLPISMDVKPRNRRLKIPPDRLKFTCPGHRTDNSSSEEIPEERRLREGE
jgi:hypothetical protein